MPLKLINQNQNLSILLQIIKIMYFDNLSFFLISQIVWEFILFLNFLSKGFTTYFK